MNDLRIDRVASPMGDLQLVTHRDALCALDFADRDATMRERLRERFGDVELREDNDPAGHSTRLRAYLAGDLQALDGTLVETGGTEFQQRVWRALREVPSGTTKSYAEIAEAVGQPGASRAVGTANGKNPIALVIPCHRVVNASGKLGGYAGGVDRKRWLLQHEGAQALG